MIDPNKLLPKYMIILGADTHLYRIGLSLYSDENIKRHPLYNPILVFIIISHLSVRLPIYLKYMNVKEPEFHVLIGNIGYFTGNTMIACIGFGALAIIASSSQIINLYNYKYDIKPTFLKIFQMMAGMITPISVGINDRNLCYKLLRISKYLLKFGIIIERSLFIDIFIALFLMYDIRVISTPILFLISIINIFFMSLALHYIYYYHYLAIHTLLYYHILFKSKTKSYKCKIKITYKLK